MVVVVLFTVLDEVGVVPAPILPLCLTVLVVPMEDETVEVVLKPGDFPAPLVELSTVDPTVEVEPVVLLQPLGLSVQDFPPGSPIAGSALSAIKAAKAAGTPIVSMMRRIMDTSSFLSFLQSYPTRDSVQVSSN
jgi:hypothetical protein